MNRIQSFDPSRRICGPRSLQPRRGVTLLFVVSMIVLFLLMGTAFVLVSNDFRKNAERMGRLNLTFDNGAELLEHAFFEAFVGPDLDNVHSPLRGNSVLADLYGYGFKAQVQSLAASGANGSGDQLLTLTLGVVRPGTAQTVANNAFNIRLGQGNPANDFGIEPLSNIPGFYNGFVLSFTSGAARGVSSRVVSYDGGATFAFSVVADWSDINRASGDVIDNIAVGDEIVVNGPTFSGFGAGGLNTSAGSSTAALGPTALLPRRVGDQRAVLTAAADSGNPGYLANNAGVNEPYDALDYQNMFLAGNSGASTTVMFGRPGSTGSMPPGWRPSFHDARLVNYNRAVNANPENFMFAVDANSDGIPDYGVDSDGDGIVDAVFIDIGFPVQSHESGRLFKPMVAYRIEDLDGRVNINAAGSQAQLDNQVVQQVVPYDVAGATGNNQPLGQGLGPAEINPGALYAGTAVNYYQQLLFGNGNRPGRYGADQVPGFIGRDYFGQHKYFGYPAGPSNFAANQNGNLFRNNGTRTKFSTPLDIHGRFTYVASAPDQTANPAAYTTPHLDPNFADLPNGQYGINMLVSGYVDDIINNPYEKSFARGPAGGAGDRFFSPQELERVFRRFDRDSYSLPSRLFELGFVDPGTSDFSLSLDASIPGSITIASWEQPRVSQGIVLVDRLARRLQNNGIAEANSYLMARSMLGPEISVGLPLNINREWGNGYDNNNNGTVDEMEETASNVETNIDQTVFQATYGNPAIQMNGIGPGSRALLAQNLYVLTLLTCEEELDLDLNGTIGASERIEYRRRIAQWAINCMDFRDADSIRTLFEFDTNPFNGWDVDGDPSTDEGGERQVVIGLERPEVKLTETFAGHDVRIEDDSSGDPQNRVRPNAFAFVEVYNPWTQNAMSQTLPPELYNTDPVIGDGVNLSRTTPGGESVWRLASSREESDPFTRVFYLADDGPTIPDPSVGTASVFSANPANNSNPAIVPPGWSCVIGPPGFDPENDGVFITPMGRLSDRFPGDEMGNLGLDETRRIELDPDNRTVVIDQGPASPETTYNAVSIVVNSISGAPSARGMSLSDPANAYFVPGLTEEIDDGVLYPIPVMPPQDEARTPNSEFNAVELTSIATGDSTLANFRTIHLQRLANPLLDFNPDTNPYVTIDTMPVSLFSFNGLRPGTTNVDTSSFELGENEPANIQLQRSFWGPAGMHQTMNGLPGAGDHFMDREINVTLGAVNDAFRDEGGFVGAANEPGFASLNWNNRPYSSHLELAQVPYLSSEELTDQYSLARESGLFSNPYEVDPQVDPVDNTVHYIGGRFGHLLNFFGADDTGSIQNRRGEFYRLMDFVQVPSRFIGTETFLNGSVFTTNPFNFVSDYRQPGKINLNTVPNQLVWNCLMGQYATIVNFATAVNARNGLGGNPLLPTDVLNPYRTAESSNWVPPVAPVAGGPNSLVVEPVDCGLFRRNAAGTRPLFELNNGGYLTARDSSVRNHMMQRLGNMTTSRSSVFSMWITIGFFEINPANGQVIGEIGELEGEIVRHRAFYLIDRSIPVAFEPGRRHNVERAILSQSIIEIEE